MIIKFGLIMGEEHRLKVFWHSMHLAKCFVSLFIHQQLMHFFVSLSHFNSSAFQFLFVPSSGSFLLFSNIKMTYGLFVNKKWHRLKVFGNRVLRKMFGYKEEESNQRQKKNCIMRIYSSFSIIGVIKSRRMRWVGCVACM